MSNTPNPASFDRTTARSAPRGRVIHPSDIRLEDFDAVLFDMDGVLLDTEPLYTVAYDKMLEPFGKKLDMELKTKMMGRPALYSAGLAIEKYGIPMTAAEFVEKRKPILEELVQNAPSLPGAEDFVRHLTSLGLRAAVATSTARPVFAVKTARHPWFSLFAAVVCSDDADVAHPKPAPDIFLAAAARLGADPKRCLVFEDSPAGIEAGLATGGTVVAVLTMPIHDPGNAHAAIRGWC